MNWWLKVRRAHILAPTTIILFTVLVAVVGDRTMVLPTFTAGSTAGTRVMLFVPVAITVGVMACLEARLPAPELASTRHVPLLDAGLALTVVSTCVCTAYALGQPTAGRNALFLTGLMLCARPLVGQKAVMMPVAWLLAVLFVGYRTPQDSYPWAILPEPAGAAHATAIAVVAFTIGLASLLRSPRNTT
ncbi:MULTISPECIES: hypothetical protein [unclassified Streptomyces]|uniref:hypothetical protein n=1 Tax=unclassified Streptomyces TaxID=2593676 RepID=UPI00336A95C1